MNIQELIDEAFKSMAPPLRMLPSECAEKFRHLPLTSPEPGPFRFKRAKFQKGIIDCVAEPGIKRGVCKKSSQVGVTEVLLSLIAYFSKIDIRGGIMFVLPRIKDAEQISKERVQPMFDCSPELRNVLASMKTRDSRNTITYKEFKNGDGYLFIVGSNAPADLASRPCPIILFDETARIVTEGKEGNPILIAKKRANNFFNKFFFEVSTPTEEGNNIDVAFEESDKRYFYMPCPHCNEFILFKWKNLKWQDDDPSTAKMMCEKCTALIDHADKFKMLDEGEWRATEPFNGTAGFFVNELYSPWVTWEEMVKNFLTVKDKPDKLKVFVNTSLGESWTDKRDIPKHELIFEQNRLSYKSGTIPKDVCFLAYGLDVQGDRIEMEIIGFALNDITYSIDYRIIYGDPNNPDTWKKVTKVEKEQFKHELGGTMSVMMGALDTGYLAHVVYNFVRQNPARRMAVKGYDKQPAILGVPSIIDINYKGKRIKRGIRLWKLGVNLLKSITYGRLNLMKTTDDVPAGYCYFPNDYTKEYFEGLISEHQVEYRENGITKYKWKKLPGIERNEPLDVRGYGLSAAQHLGIDKMTDEQLLEVKASQLNQDIVGIEPKKKKKKKKISNTSGV